MRTITVCERGFNLQVIPLITHQSELLPYLQGEGSSSVTLQHSDQ